MLPIWVVGVLLLGLWETVALFWFILDPYWTRIHMTEARKQERKTGKENSRRGGVVTRAWRVLAPAVSLLLPVLFVVDALLFPLGLLYAPALTYFPPFAVAWQLAGVAIALVGLAIMLTVGHTLAREIFSKAEPERELITHGLHAYVRHPFYLHFLLVPLGLLLLTLNGLFLLLVLFYNTLFGPKSPLTMMREEEAQLLERYGRAYETYMERTGRFLPKLRR